MRSRGLGIEHRVVDDELAAALEDLSERLPTVFALERVLLLDTLPRQFAPLPAELVAKASEPLFLDQMLLSGRHPFVVADYFVGCHLVLLLRVFDSSSGSRTHCCSVRRPLRVREARRETVRRPRGRSTMRAVAQPSERVT